MLLCTCLFVSPLIGTLENELQKTKEKIEQLEQIIEMREKRISDILATCVENASSCSSNSVKEEVDYMIAEGNRLKNGILAVLNHQKDPHIFFREKFFSESNCPFNTLEQLKYGLIRYIMEHSILQENYMEYQNHVIKLVEIEKELYRRSDH